MGWPLVRVSFAMKKHHDHGKPYKGKHLIGGDLQFRGHHGKQPLSRWETTMVACRHAAGEGAEGSTS